MTLTPSLEEPGRAASARAETGLAAIVRGFGAARVLVLGDVMLDRYVSGAAHRLSPEAPIPVLRPSGSRCTLGGAANVAVNVATLGGSACLIGVVGDDPAAAELRRLLALWGERVRDRLATEPGRPTTCKTRFMAGSHQLLRLDEEATAPVGPLDLLLERYDETLRWADVVVLSDYAKGVLCDALLPEALDRARAMGRPVIADPKRADLAAYRGAAVLTPNEAEARLATGIDATEDAGAEQAGRRILDATGCEAVLITRSERGVSLLRRGSPAIHLPTQAREVADVSGAGDTLVAALAVAMAVGADLPQASALANVTAGISVAKQGTATVSREELQSTLLLRDLAATDSKVVGIDQAAAQAAEWRRQGLRIGFTNGCFDLVHPGHVRLLAESRAACDRLIVGLNTDASVQRLKGPARPVQNELARATVMASIGAVDLVVLFAEDTPLALIEALRPDVLVKGADYTVAQVVGADRVRSWGGRVHLVDLQQGHSTTRMVRLIAGRGEQPAKAGGQAAE